MTIYDISKEAGVSIATVSRILNGNVNVSDKTRDKVLAVMDKYSYTPNAFARGLCTNTIQTIGILCADSSDDYLARAVYQLEQNMRENGYDSILCCTGYEAERRRKYTNILLSKKIDALIYVGSTFVGRSDEENQYIISASLQVPVIMVNGYIDAPRIWGVLCDDYIGTYEITRRLLSCGRERLLFLAHGHSHSSALKERGFRQAHADAEIRMMDSQCQYMVLSVHDAVERLRTTFGIVPFFNGIVATSDELAIPALKYVKMSGLVCPDDVFIVGYNNSRFTEFVEPELSSIDNKPGELCSNAVRILLEVLSGASPPKELYIPSELIERSSTCF